MTIGPVLQLLGVIVLNFACNIGEVVLSGVELGYTLRGSREVFAQSKIVVGVITINNFLKVVNSSLNFVIYCKDVVFRYRLKLHELSRLLASIIRFTCE